eukprot:13629-Heterococcus_DN1.PRE.1
MALAITGAHRHESKRRAAKQLVARGTTCTAVRAQRCKQTVAVAAAVGTRETIISSSSSSSIMLLRCAQDARQQERVVPLCRYNTDKR